MAGLDRYFGGGDGAAERRRKQLQEEHGAVRGDQRFQALLAGRRRAYKGRGRGVGLQKAVSDAVDGND